MIVFMRITLFTCLLCLSFFPSIALGISEFECRSGLTAPESEQLLEKVERKYSTFSDLEANFLQRSFFLGLGQVVLSKGSVRFKTPGMMDWQYEQPEKQRFVTDGTALWFYQPDLNQVMIAAFSSSFDSELPVSFLLGVGSLKQTFSLKSACRSEAGHVFSLEPKKADPNLAEFYLLSDPQTYLPLGAKVVDVGGNDTVILFHGIKLNVGLKKESFSFSPPLGVDIIDERGADKKPALSYVE